MKAKQSKKLAVILFVFLLGLAANISAAVYIKTAPPARKIVVRQAKPFKAAVWVSGHWAFKNGRYVWVAGKWQKARPGYVWVDGHWKKTAKGWTWVQGHWRKK